MRTGEYYFLLDHATVYLALGDDTQARTHLQLALQFGDTASDIHLALGQALGRLHDQEVRDVLRRYQGEQVLGGPFRTV